MIQATKGTKQVSCTNMLALLSQLGGNQNEKQDDQRLSCRRGNDSFMSLSLPLSCDERVSELMWIQTLRQTLRQMCLLSLLDTMNDLF